MSIIKCFFSMKASLTHHNRTHVKYDIQTKSHSGIDTWGTGHPGSWSPQAQGHCWGCQESYFTRETRGGDQCQCRCSKCMILLLVITITLHNIKVTKCTATLTPSSPSSSCARFATLSSAACALPTQERWSLLENWNWHSYYSASYLLCVSYLSSL